MVASLSSNVTRCAGCTVGVMFTLICVAGCRSGKMTGCNTIAATLDSKPGCGWGGVPICIC